MPRIPFFSRGLNIKIVLGGREIDELRFTAHFLKRQFLDFKQSLEIFNNLNIAHELERIEGYLNEMEKAVNELTDEKKHSLRDESNIFYVIGKLLQDIGSIVLSIQLRRDRRRYNSTPFMLEINKLMKLLDGILGRILNQEINFYESLRRAQEMLQSLEERTR